MKDDARFYYVHEPTAANIEALVDDPNVAGTVGFGRVQRPVWREFLARVSPLRLAPALHSRQNGQAWLYWLFWSLPVVVIAMLGWRSLHRGEWWPGELAGVAGLAAMTLLVNSGFLRDPLSDRLADAVVPPSLLVLIGRVWTNHGRVRSLQVLGRAFSVAVLFVTATAVAANAALPERMDYTGMREGVRDPRGRRCTPARQLSSPDACTAKPRFWSVDAFLQLSRPPLHQRISWL